MILEDAVLSITQAWMVHLGYEPDQIAAAETQEHADLCEFNGEFWECHDEDGGSHHPVCDEMDNAAAMVMFVLEHPACAAAAEARGYRKAIDALRAQREWNRSEGLLAFGAAFDIAASYLETTEGDAR